MKIGIITDVHSNIQALNVILKEFDKLKVDKIICCGDIVGIGINPEEVVQTLIKRKDMLIAVSGNHEGYVIHGLPETIHDEKRKLSKQEIENHKWNYIKLSKQSKDFLKKLRKSRTIKIQGKKIYVVHYPYKEDGTFKKHIKKPNLIENKEMFKEIDADIYLYGHTHTYRVNIDKDKWYINVGSLGCPKNDFNIARAGILEMDNGQIQFNEINIEYNVKEIIDEINELKFPFYKRILKIFYGV